MKKEIKKLHEDIAEFQEEEAESLTKNEMKLLYFLIGQVEILKQLIEKTERVKKGGN